MGINVSSGLGHALPGKEEISEAGDEKAIRDRD
jgi:hypothetical protein